jgi:hypothetical protein
VRSPVALNSELTRAWTAVRVWPQASSHQCACAPIEFVHIHQAHAACAARAVGTGGLAIGEKETDETRGGASSPAAPVGKGRPSMARNQRTEPALTSVSRHEMEKFSEMLRTDIHTPSVSADQVARREHVRLPGVRGGLCVPLTAPCATRGGWA